MDTERLVSVGLTCVVVVAIGLSAATLASSMSTDPADAVDPDYELLPIGEDRSGDVEEAAQRLHDRYAGNPTEGSSSPDADASASTTQSEVADTRAPQQSGSGDGDTPGVVSGNSLVQVLLVVVLLAALVSLAYRYRGALISLLGMVVGADDPPKDGNETLMPAPENEVQRAWVTLLRKAGIARERTRTPRDCARAAVETGFDADAVHRLRRTFEDVQYGGEPPSGERERVARETLRSLREDEQ